MYRSPDILLQIQNIRHKRKKPKTRDFLKSVRIRESQRSQIRTARWSSTQFFTQKRTGERNSVALLFAIGIHVIFAILLAINFFNTNPILNEHNLLRLKFLVITNRYPKPHPPPHPPHPPSRPSGNKHPQRNPFIREIDITPFDLPYTQDNFTLSDSDDLTVDMSDHLESNNRKSYVSRQIKSVPLQKYILKLPSIQLNEGQVLSKTSSNILKGTKTDDDYDLLEPLENVGTETIPLQTNLIARPTYPQYAQMMKKQGTVRLQATIGKDGIPKDIQVLTNLGYGLEEAVVAAVKKSRYIPAKKNGTAIDCLVEIQFEFKLQE